MKTFTIFLLFLASCHFINTPLDKNTYKESYWRVRELMKDTLINRQQIKYTEELIVNSSIVITNYYTDEDSLVSCLSYDIYNQQYFYGHAVDTGKEFNISTYTTIDTTNKLVYITFWQNYERGDSITYFLIKDNYLKDTITFNSYPSAKTPFKYSDFHYDEGKNQIILDYKIFVVFKSKREILRMFSTTVFFNDAEMDGINNFKRYIRINKR